MEVSDDNLYEPIQPSSGENKFISYEELKPSAPVSEYVYCYWQLKTVKKLTTDFQYRVVADGCIDIFFETSKPSESFVMGFYNKFHQFPLGKEFNYLGIRFKPSYFSQIFNVNAMALSDKTCLLMELNKEAAEFIEEEFKTEISLVELKNQFALFLGQYFSKALFVKDDRFHNALQLILKKRGLLDVESDLKTGLSPRQLRRVFNFYIGTSPKSFSKVIRFQSVIRRLHTSSTPQKSAYYLDSGFFDQAHFIKDFKLFYGVTPRQAGF